MNSKSLNLDDMIVRVYMWENYHGQTNAVNLVLHMKDNEHYGAYLSVMPFTRSGEFYQNLKKIGFSSEEAKNLMTEAYDDFLEKQKQGIRNLSNWDR